MLYIEFCLCNNGAACEAPVSNGPLSTGTLSLDKGIFATWEPVFMRFVLATCVAMALVFSAAVQADVAKGKSTYAARGCIGCHGAGGVSTVTTNPSLKGRDGDFIRQNLTDFRSGARKNPVMNAMAAGLKDADIDHLADYINSLQ
jgi:cytochrome c553